MLLLKNMGIVSEPTLVNVGLNIDIGQIGFPDNYWDIWKETQKPI